MNKDQLIALSATLLIALMIFSALWLTVLPATSLTAPKAQADEEAEVFFADIDYKQILSNPTPQVDGQVASAAASDNGGTDLTDSGSGRTAPDLVATETPEPENTQIEKPDDSQPAGPSQEEIEEQKRAAIRAKLGKATGLKATENQSSGSAESGNAATGNNPNATGLGLNGRKLQNRPDPGIKNAQGRVWVRITVNGEGNVTNAVFVRSSGFGSRESEVRSACVEASRKLRYNADPKTPTQSGEICWIIK